MNFKEVKLNNNLTGKNRANSENEEFYIAFNYIFQ